MKLGTDAQGKVWLVGDSIPAEWNGIALTTHDLTPGQIAAYAALPERAGTLFDGSAFTAIPAPAPTQAQVNGAATDANIAGFSFGGKTLAELKAMSIAEFDTWWAANITNLAQANTVLKLLARAALQRML